MPRTSPYSILLTEEERQVLECDARKYTSPYYQVIRSKIILNAAKGMGNDEIGHMLDLPRQIVSKWRKRFFEKRLSGLEDEARQGRPPSFSPSGSH